MRNILIIAFLILSACTAPDRTEQTLRNAGFTNISITGYNMFECSEDDQFHTGFEATNPIGARVQGTVCCGMLKGCTVRF